MENHNQDKFTPALDLKDYFRLIGKHKFIIIPVIFCCLIGFIYYHFSSIPTYQTSTLIIVEKENKQNQYLGIDTGIDEANIIQEIAILKSQTLAKNVINLLINSENKNNLFALKTRIYETKVPNISNYFFNQSKNDIYNIDNLNNHKKNVLANLLKRNLKINSSRNSNILTVTYNSPDPTEAVYVLNTIIKVYKKLDRDWKNSEILDLSNFLKNQISTVSKDLNLIENKIMKFKETEKYISGIDEVNPLMKQYMDYETILLSTQAEFNIIEKEIIYYKNLLKENESKIISIADNQNIPVIESILNEINRLESLKIKSIYKNSNLSNSIVSENFDLEIKNLRNNLDQEIKNLNKKGIDLGNPILYSQEIIKKLNILNNTKEQLFNKSNEFSDLLSKIGNQMQKLPSKNLILAGLTREKSVKEHMYLLLSEKMEQSKITKASQKENVRIIDEAFSSFKLKPKLKNTLIYGFIAGILISMIIILLIEYLDQSIRSIDTIQKLGISVIGVIPQVTNKNQKLSKYLEDNEYSNRLITFLDPLNPVSEAYRSIRTNILYSNLEKNIKTIMVSSPGPSEGKTTTAINIAITYAQLGRKTVIVDTDLRKPMLHKIFDIKREIGVSDYLNDIENLKIETIIKETEVENLSVIPSGKLMPNPSELLGSKNMKKVILELKNNFDLVIFDTPPIIPVTDSRVVANQIDSMLLIVKSGQTDYHQLSRAKTLLDSVNTSLVGCVLNAFSSKHGAYGDYASYYEYYYSDTK